MIWVAVWRDGKVRGECLPDREPLTDWLPDAASVALALHNADRGGERG